jgi:Zn-dependent protease with chaperone function
VSDVAAFVAACIATPALLTSACALVVVPALAWAVVRALAPSLARMSDDPGWQAPLAAAAAGLPGALFLVIGAATLRGGWDSACLQFATGRVLYAAIAALTAFGLVRAVVLAVRRGADVARLVGRSREPSARARSAGESAGVRIRELDAAGPVVLLAGVLRPVVLVSAGALRRVDDAELLAAVRHEAAHARRGDLVCAALVSFVADLVPLPVGSLIALHRRAREFAADAHAARVADPCDLAAALVALARQAEPAAASAAFAEAGTVRDRLGALLAPTSPRPSAVRRAVLVAALAATFVLGAGPVLAALALGFTCSMAMPA